MAAPLQTRKKSVNLSPPVRGSRIRRDPPPVVKKVEIKDPEERDTEMVVIGVIGFAVAIFIVVLGFSAYYGTSTPDERPIHLNLG